MKRTIINLVVVVLGVLAIGLILGDSDDFTLLLLSKVIGIPMFYLSARLFERINGEESV